MWCVRWLEVLGGGRSGEGQSVASGGMMCGCCGGADEIRACAACFLDRMFARLACMCPFIVGIWFGGQRRSCFTVMVGNVVRKLAWIALAKVSRVGEKSDLCWKSILSAMVGASITEFSE